MGKVLTRAGASPPSHWIRTSSPGSVPRLISDRPTGAPTSRDSATEVILPTTLVVSSDLRSFGRQKVGPNLQSSQGSVHPAPAVDARRQFLTHRSTLW